jgi:ribosomal protein L21E
MPEFSTGDRVRVDIPDETDPDHEAYHGVHGRVVTVLTDDAGEVTGETVDSRLYRIELDTGEEMDFRRRDLRPPITGSGES